MQRNEEVQSPPVSSLPFSFQETVGQFEPPKTGEVAPKRSSPSRDWEQVSPLQRVLGTITDIQISNGNVQSIDLKKVKKTNPVIDKVDYD
ncbi:hypothetical protein D3C73_1224970 [compost metagenome]